jgi:hypothetical protein
MLQDDGRPPRVPFDTTVVVSDGHRQIPARAANISSGGMLLLPQQTLRVGDMVFLGFSLQGYFAEVQAEVVRHAREQSKYAVGVKFRGAPAGLLEGIRRLASATPPRKVPKAEDVDLVMLYEQALRQIEEEQRDQPPRRFSLGRLR